MKRLGVAFVTFRDERMTAVWVWHHKSVQAAAQEIEDYWALLCTPDLNLSFICLSSIVKDYTCVSCRRRPQQSSVTTVVQSHKWGVSYAPAPSDIIWSVEWPFYLSQSLHSSIFPPLLVLRSLPLSIPAVQLLHGWNASQHPHEHENPLTYMSLNSRGEKKTKEKKARAEIYFWVNIHTFPCN